jgi:hypothetical protein
MSTYIELTELIVKPKAMFCQNLVCDAFDNKSSLNKNATNTDSRNGNSQNVSEQINDVINNNYEVLRQQQLSLQREMNLTKPIVPMITIDKYFGSDDNLLIENWFKKFELYAKTMNWIHDEEKKKYLWTQLENIALDYYFELNSNVKTYIDMKSKIIKRFTQSFNSPLNHREMTNRRYKKNESINCYLYDKLKLINKAEPTMSFAARKNHVLEGLDAELFGEVMKYITVSPVQNIDELFQAIKTIYQIEDAKRLHKQIVRSCV